MIEQDTIKLLRECDAGVQMGIASIEDVMDDVESPLFRAKLEECRTTHEALDKEIQTLLDEYHDDGKEPSPVASGMSWMKTTLKLSMEHSDRTIADLMIDGCNMGVKSLTKYLNQYENANEKAKDITRRLITSEEKLVYDIRSFL